MGHAKVACCHSDLDPVADLVPDTEGMLIMMLSDNTIPAGKVLRRIDRRQAA